MAVRLNHTIVAARDEKAGAAFLCTILGLPAPSMIGHFASVKVGDTSLDYTKADGNIVHQHYAFLVSETEFDQIFERVSERRLPYWADPFRHEANRINDWDDGRGFYFEDPSGHLLEVITRPYGSGGTAVAHPHPLIAPSIDPKEYDSGDRRGELGGSALAGAERPDRRET